jgi:DNA-binding CsgD family transcriptional regulator
MKNLCPPTQTFSQARQASGRRQINGMETALTSILGAIALRRSLVRTAIAEAQLQRASAAFMTMLDERFAEWRLTPAERDVALFAIKGMSLQEIATLRQTSEGTVKAQTNAIYRKAGVSGRPQLLSLFIEELMSNPVTDRPPPPEVMPDQIQMQQSHR